MTLNFEKKLLLLTLKEHTFYNDQKESIPFYRADVMDNEANEVFQCTIDKKLVSKLKVGTGYNFVFSLFIGSNQTRLKIVDITE